MKMKSILKEWRNYNNKINEMSQLYGIDPTEFNGQEFNISASSQKADMTNLDLKDTIKVLCDLIKDNESLYISFVDKYDKDVPKLEVNPTITFETPHGIYGYPLNKDSLIRFLSKGKPTEADFAANRAFFHVYRSSGENKITINSDRSTNYNNKNYVKDLKTIVHVYLNYLLSFIIKTKLNDFVKDDIKTKTDILENIPSNEIKAYSNLFYYVVACYEQGILEENKRPDDVIVNDICVYLDQLSKTNLNRFKDEVYSTSKFFNLYFASRALANAIKLIHDIIPGFSYDVPKSGGLFTILLSSIGINTVEDLQGTSTIHPAEPSQVFITDISNANNYILLGTFNNPFYFNNSQPGVDIKAKIIEIVESLINEGLIDIDYHRINDVKLSFEKFKKIVEEIKLAPLAYLEDMEEKLDDLINIRRTSDMSIPRIICSEYSKLYSRKLNELNKILIHKEQDKIDIDLNELDIDQCRKLVSEAKAKLLVSLNASFSAALFVLLDDRDRIKKLSRSLLQFATSSVSTM